MKKQQNGNVRSNYTFVRNILGEWIEVGSTNLDIEKTKEELIRDKNLILEKLTSKIN